MVVLPVGTLRGAVGRAAPVEQQGAGNQIKDHAIRKTSFSKASRWNAGAARKIADPSHARKFGHDFLISWHYNPDIDATLAQRQWQSGGYLTKSSCFSEASDLRGDEECFYS